MRTVSLSILTLMLVAGIAHADFVPEKVGTVRTLPETPGPHWFWLSDIVLRRAALFDGDSGELLGTISSGTGAGLLIAPLFSRERREIYIAESYFSRGTRGERTDVVSVYDATTLQPLAEIEIPPKRAEYYPGNASSALSDDGRFVAVFNLTPATSLTVADVKERRFAAEIPSPGCSLVFAAGPRRFFMICPNGDALVVEIGENGEATKIGRSKPFFDAKADPVTEKAVRVGDEWLFVSFEGMVHTVDVSGAELGFGEPWPLFDESDRKEKWRVGGLQHLAVHAASGRLYVLVHQGERDTHKAPGTEVWVYDIRGRRRLERMVLANPLVNFVALQGGFGNAGRWVLKRLLPNPGIERILVTQDEKPMLVASGSLPPLVSIYDAMNGELRREITEPGLVATLFYAP